MSFWELFVVGIIALIVLGPERLPKAARTLGTWVGKAKQSFNSIKNEIDRELKVQELQQQLEEQKNALNNQLDSEQLGLEKIQLDPLNQQEQKNAKDQKQDRTAPQPIAHKDNKKQAAIPDAKAPPTPPPTDLKND